MWTAIIAAIASATVAIISTAAMERRRKREQEAELERLRMMIHPSIRPPGAKTKPKQEKQQK